jgi:hypothetical protein
MTNWLNRGDISLRYVTLIGDRLVTCDDTCVAVPLCDVDVSVERSVDEFLKAAIADVAGRDIYVFVQERQADLSHNHYNTSKHISSNSSISIISFQSLPPPSQIISYTIYTP